MRVPSRAGRAQASAGSSDQTGRRRRPAGGDGSARRPDTAPVFAEAPGFPGSRAAGGLSCSSSRGILRRGARSPRPAPPSQRTRR